MGAARAKAFDVQLALELRREKVARDLRRWRARRPFAPDTLQLDAELREIDAALAALDPLRFQ